VIVHRDRTQIFLCYGYRRLFEKWKWSW